MQARRNVVGDETLRHERLDVLGKCKDSDCPAPPPRKPERRLSIYVCLQSSSCGSDTRCVTHPHPHPRQRLRQHPYLQLRLIR
eukprot:365833-Chlamydomonas_euryale.AAC.1